MEAFTSSEFRYFSEGSRMEEWFDTRKPFFAHDIDQSSTDSHSSRSGPSTPEQTPAGKGSLSLLKLETSYAALKEKNAELTAELDRAKAITQTLRYVVASKDEEIKKMLLPKVMHNLPPIIRRKSSPANKSQH